VKLASPGEFDRIMVNSLPAAMVGVWVGIGLDASAVVAPNQFRVQKPLWGVVLNGSADVFAIAMPVSKPLPVASVRNGYNRTVLHVVLLEEVSE